jgi:uncharacterized protein (TIGR01244 family)
MAIQFFMRDEQFATAAQLGADDMAEVVQLGFKTLINNRPDGEGGPEQPTAKAVQEAAEKAGLHYVYLPVVSGQITMEQVQSFASTLESAQQPVLAFCRSGARSAQLAQFAKSL